MACSWHLSSMDSLYLSKPVQLQTKAVSVLLTHREKRVCAPPRWTETSSNEKSAIFSVVSNMGKLSKSMGCIAAQPFLMAQGGEAAVRTCTRGRGGGRNFYNHGRSHWRSLIQLSQIVAVFNILSSSFSLLLFRNGFSVKSLENLTRKVESFRDQQTQTPILMEKADKLL